MNKKHYTMHGNKSEAETFLNQMNWKAVSGDLKNITTFQIDVYRFTFWPKLKTELVPGFLEYIKNLDMSNQASIVNIFVWLHRHEVKFSLKFGWNPNRSVSYNLSSVCTPKRIRKTLLRHCLDQCFKRI